DLRTDRAAHAGISCAHVILVEPRTIDSMMARGRSEIPDPGFAGSREERVPNQLVASPFADDCARYVTDVVLVEAQHRAEARLRQRFTRPSQTITMQTLEIDALFKVHLRGSGRLQRPVPSVGRLEIVFVDRQEFGFV